MNEAFEWINIDHHQGKRMIVAQSASYFLLQAVYEKSAVEQAGEFIGDGDTHDHLAGDELLEEIGHLFRNLIRESDFAARYGGEEFVVVMPETESEMALSLAQRICEAVSIHPFRQREIQPGGKVTISAGIACFPTDAPSAEQLIQKADQALYRAKREGKNRVCRAAL